MSILFSLSSSSVFFVFYPKMDVRSFSGPANKEGDLLTFLDGLLGLLHFYIPFYFLSFSRCNFFFFADCNSVEKEHQGMFYLLKIAFQRSSSGTYASVLNLGGKTNSPDWCFWGPSGFHRANPSSWPTVRPTAGISTHGWWLWIGCICLHPKPYSTDSSWSWDCFFFILRFLTSFTPLESGKNDQPLTGWNIAEVHLIFKLQNCFYLPWGKAHLSYV